MTNFNPIWPRQKKTCSSTTKIRLLCCSLKSTVTFVCMHYHLQQIGFVPRDLNNTMRPREWRAYELHFFLRCTHKSINNWPVWGRRCEYWSPPAEHFSLHETHKSVDVDHQPKSWHRFDWEECLIRLQSKNTIVLIAVVAEHKNCRNRVTNKPVQELNF